jgi:hypothetical protein
LTATRVRFVHSIAERASFEEVRFLDNRSGQHDYPEHKAKTSKGLAGIDRSTACKFPNLFTTPKLDRRAAAYR